MRIVNKGVRIEDTPWPIEITPDAERPFRFTDQEWTREALTEVRDALTEALRQLDCLTGAEPSEPVRSSGFHVGQVLTGEEDLPIGTVVEDSDKSPDTWTFRGDLWETTDGDTVSVQRWRGTIEHYGPVTIVSLP